MNVRRDLDDSAQRSAHRQRAAAIFMAMVIGLVAVMAVHALVEFWRGYDREPDAVTATIKIVLLAVAGLLYVGAGGVALTMLGGRGVRSVARYTILQCVRTKVTAVFVVLIVLGIVLIYQVQGDGTLGGRIRTFLSYSTGMLGVLLGVLTLFLSVGLISGDVEDRQVFTTVTKPLARWEYVVGRWMGIAAVNAMVLVLAGAGIYALAQHLRSVAPQMPFADRRTVETEVFVARRLVPADPLPIETATTMRIEQLKKDGRYERSLQDYLNRTGGDTRRAESYLRQAIADDMTGLLQTVGPGRGRDFGFSGIEVRAATISDSGTVVKLFLDGPKKHDPVVRVQINPKLTSHLQLGGPMDVDGISGTVVWGGRNFVDVMFTPDRFEQLSGPGLPAGKTLKIQVVPVIQFTYRLNRASSESRVSEAALRGQWQIFNPDPDTPIAIDLGQRQLALHTTETETIPAAVVSKDGKTVARFINNAPVSIEVSHANLGVLYPTGSFEGNFLRVLGLMYCWVLFWAAAGLMMGSFMQFSVAWAATAMLFIVSMTLQFALEAVQRPTGFVMVAAGWILHGLDQVLPGLSDHVAGGYLIDGMMLPWLTFGQTVVTTLAFKSLLILILASGIFRYRELARVQV